MLPLTTLAMVLPLTSPLAAADLARKFSPQQLQEDFQIARRALEDGHPGLYRYTTKTEMDRIFDQAGRSLDHPMDFYEFYRVMALPIAAIKCGHTDVSIDPEVMTETERLPWFPFEVKVLERKAYIFRDYVQKGKLAGKEIASINGVPADRIISMMLAAESQDGDIQTSRQRVIAQNFARNLIVLLGIQSPYEVTLVGSDAKQTETIQVAGLKHDEIVKISKSLYPQDQGGKPSKELRFLDNGKIACLTYSFFGTDIEEARAFMQHAFDDIQSKGSKTLILDLRGNVGGEGEIGEILLSHIVAEPFKYYADLIVNKDTGMSYYFAKYSDKHRDGIVPPGLVELRADGKVHQTNDPLTSLQQIGKPNFKGRIFLLINGRCFSSGAEFLTEVHVHHRATFIGEESAGAYYGNNSGDVERITLPNTKLGIYIPLVSGYMAVGDRHEHDPARGVTPDYPIQYTIAELLAGVDKEFDLALELSRKSP